MNRSKTLINTDAYKIIFGRVISGLRKQREFSQGTFSKMIGVSQPTLSRFERGLALPDILMAKNIARALGRDLAYLDATVDRAISDTVQASHEMVPVKATEGDFWNSLLTTVGAVAVAGLAGFAVAAILKAKSDEEGENSDG